MSVYGSVNGKFLKGLVDSAVVGMDVTDDDLRDIIDEFKKYPETSVVVVNFHQAKLAVEMCKGSHVAPCVVIAYPPLCSVPTEIKVNQAIYAVEELGVSYVLFTIDHSKFKDKLFDDVQKDVEAVVKAVNHRASVLVMPDFAHWTTPECIHLAEIIRDAGADMIKSTGGMGRLELPSTIDGVVKAMKGSVPIMGTSAIRNLDDTLKMLSAKPDKIAISRSGFFQTLEEVEALDRVKLTKEKLAKRTEGMIWHPLTSEAEAKQYLVSAKEAGLYGVSVDPRWVPLATEVLKDSATKVIARVDQAAIQNRYY